VLAGDEGAARELVGRHLRSAHAVARIVLDDASDADDVCQDAFAAAFARLGQCRPAHQFRPWLLRIARNRAISVLRQRRVRRAATLGGGFGETDPPAPASDDPLRAAERSELRTRLAAALRRLPASQREALLLHDVEGWKHDEIAAHLGVRPGTSRSYLFDARRALRAALGPELAPGAR
jgi:RNA polymerase sigma-70 factor (ECF subfamily)